HEVVDGRRDPFLLLSRKVDRGAKRCRDQQQNRKKAAHPAASLRKLALMLEKHRAMLADRVRVDAYASAIRAVVKPGDLVLDLGTGTGILAFLACEAGARHVFAIDKTHKADMASLLARHHGL